MEEISINIIVLDPKTTHDILDQFLLTDHLWVKAGIHSVLPAKPSLFFIAEKQRKYHIKHDSQRGSCNEILQKSNNHFLHGKGYLLEFQIVFIKYVLFAHHRPPYHLRRRDGLSSTASDSFSLLRTIELYSFVDIDKSK